MDLKINMRFYALVTCKNNSLNVYVHKDGFIYYTNCKFIENSLNKDPNITTGYIERQVYIDNPLTHDDLKTYLDNNINMLDVEKHIKSQGLQISQIFFDRIYHLLRTVFVSFFGRICKSKKMMNNLSFQLFGIDIAINNKLNPMIMEINKGPDMGAKDKRDSDLKHKVMEDLLSITGSINNVSNNKFVRILDINNGVINESDL